jgi:hypothetical protein
LNSKEDATEVDTRITKKKKDKSSKTSSSSSSKRSRYRASRPDQHKKVRNLVHSNTVKEAENFIEGKLHTKRARSKIDPALINMLRKTLTKSIDKKRDRELRKEERKVDPTVKKRLAKRRVEHLRNRIKEITALVSKRKDLESRKRERALDAEPDEYLDYLLSKIPDFPELHTTRSVIKSELELLEIKFELSLPNK